MHGIVIFFALMSISSPVESTVFYIKGMEI